jgi:two-component system, cell cycle sensor histidine kinase and response regulator CckA
VRQLLAFSRADLSEPGTLDLNDVVESVRRMLDRLLVESVEIRTELTDADTTVFADGGQLEQVLLNLAVNARDAMPEGGRLTIVTDVDEDSVVLRVSDTGVGMDEHTRERVFDPFFTTKAKGEGTGLGLSTVYGIVTKAGGRIAVTSTLGLGTAFTITLPHVAPEKPAETPVAPRQLDSSSSSGSGQRILLVEDDAMVRLVAATMLGRAGYEIATAENGEDALRLFDEGAEFDLIVSDLMMPRMTGLQLTAELRVRGHELPTVYTSGYADADIAPATDLGEARFVAKPFSGEQVVAAVRDLLQRAA